VYVFTLLALQHTQFTGDDNSSALQFTTGVPPSELQVQFHGQVQVTTLGVQLIHKLVDGLVDVSVPLALQHSIFTGAGAISQSFHV
jgi:hypothetical protein